MSHAILTQTISVQQFRALPQRTRSHETPETLEKKAIKEWLTIHNWWWYPNTAGFGVKPGIPDITAIKNSKVAQIEVKAFGGHQSKAQVDFMLDWRNKGGTYIIGGIDEVMSALAAL